MKKIIVAKSKFFLNQVFSIETYHSWDNPFTLFIPLAFMFDKIREQIGFNFSKISWRAVAVH